MKVKEIYKISEVVHRAAGGKIENIFLFLNTVFWALISYGSWFIHAFDIDQATIFGSQTPLYFSMSVSDFYASQYPLADR